jgi:hypothetical protein
MKCVEIARKFEDIVALTMQNVTSYNLVGNYKVLGSSAVCILVRRQLSPSETWVYTYENTCRTPQVTIIFRKECGLKIL